MIKKSTTMIYVENTKKAMEFWTEKLEFVLLETSDFGDAVSYEIAPSKNSVTKFCLHDKNWVAKNNPQMNVGFPSLMFEVENLEETYNKLTEKGVKTNVIMEFGGLRHFTFSDNENNYIAVKELVK